MRRTAGDEEKREQEKREGINYEIKKKVIGTRERDGEEKRKGLEHGKGHNDRRKS